MCFAGECENIANIPLVDDYLAYVFWKAQIISCHCVALCLDSAVQWESTVDGISKVCVLLICAVGAVMLLASCLPYCFSDAY